MMPYQHSALGALVVRVPGPRLDGASAPALRRELGRLIFEGNRRIVLDLSEADFIDSNGLSALVWALKNLGNSGELVISGACNTVMSMFKLTRLDRVFRIFTNHEQALAALAS
ncbi:MAG TPA: STAS domain-containing protein [Candidatus Binataceae bacterium]|nr:STAS domain-containing protein [Candidatus Binataceae bacterium]